jgi:hypothetical protein
MVGVIGFEPMTNGLKGEAQTIDNKGLTTQIQSYQTVTIRWQTVVVR